MQKTLGLARALASCAPLLVAIAVAGCGEKSASRASGASSASPAAGASTSLAEGAQAPDVELTLHDGKKQRLRDLVGKPVVVYFYPKDETTGCTVEAQEIRDAEADLAKEGVVVFGVSTQDAASHQRFIEKERLNFALVVDTDGSVAKAFGVPLKNGVAARQSFVIGKDGRVKKVFRDVNPKGHAAELLAAARS